MPTVPIHRDTLADPSSRLAARLQLALNARLQQFMSGDTLTTTAKALYPVFDRNQASPRGLVSAASDFHRHTGGLPETVSLLEKLGGSGFNRCRQAEVLSTLYREFYQHIQLHAAPSTPVSVEPALDYAAWQLAAADADYLAPIDELCRQVARLRPAVRGFYFHGSIATRDYVRGWSDFDDVVVLDKQVVTDPVRLAELQLELFRTTALLYRFDPSQHHGHGVLAEQELGYFPRSLLPPPVWQNAVCCLGEPRIVLGVREDLEDRLAIAHRLVARLQSFHARQLRNPYVLKAFASALMLLPSLYLQAKDVWCYKRDSFALARPDFGDEWEAIEIATSIRESWRDYYPRPFYARLPIDGWNPNAVRACFFLSATLSPAMKSRARALFLVSAPFLKSMATHLPGRVDVHG